MPFSFSLSRSRSVSVCTCAINAWRKLLLEKPEPWWWMKIPWSFGFQHGRRISPWKKKNTARHKEHTCCCPLKHTLQWLKIVSGFCCLNCWCQAIISMAVLISSAWNSLDVFPGGCHSCWLAFICSFSCSHAGSQCSSNDDFFKFNYCYYYYFFLQQVQKRLILYGQTSKYCLCSPFSSICQSGLVTSLLYSVTTCLLGCTSTKSWYLGCLQLF